MADGKKLALSRRQLLGGLGAVGAASAGAGLGTTALFSDEEEFENNTIQAGTLNLILRGGVIATNRDGGVSNADVSMAGPAAVENDGEVNLVLELDDVKPGDCYVVNIDEVIQDNPAYVELSLEEVADKENGYTEPEPETSSEGDTDDPGDSSGGGELDDLMEVTVWNGGNDGSRDDLVTDLSTVTCDNLADKSTTGKIIPTQTLQDAFDKLYEADDEQIGGVSIDGEFVFGDGFGNPLAVDPGTYRQFWEFSLPETVGNEVQGDSVKFNIKARIEQGRNNDSPFDGSP